jgi:hypothetical protein
MEVVDLMMSISGNPLHSIGRSWQGWPRRNPPVRATACSERVQVPRSQPDQAARRHTARPLHHGPERAGPRHRVEQPCLSRCKRDPFTRRGLRNLREVPRRDAGMGPGANQRGATGVSGRTVVGSRPSHRPIRLAQVDSATNEYELRPENEWPLARTRWTALYLDADSRTLERDTPARRDALARGHPHHTRQQGQGPRVRRASNSGLNSVAGRHLRHLSIHGVGVDHTQTPG